MSNDAVRADTVAYLLCGAAPALVEVRLSWRSEAPYAVEAVFLTGCEGVRWVLSRDLLAEGLHAEVGIGDVQVMPHEHDWDSTVMLLDSPCGHACFEFATDELSEFLEDTYDEVPLGAESLFIDLDEEIALLLEGETR
jgi:Streptomyces sporulation and cell division protein, SsgA